MKHYVFTILLAFDQFVGAFIPGAYPDETISSRAFREDWRFQSFINFLFCDKKHCEDSYWAEVNGRHRPP
jgi:hypothetical protein